MADIESIPVIEEELDLSIRSTPVGKVRVTTSTTIVEEWARAELKTDEVEVQRVAIGERIDVMPEVRTEGDTIIVPVVEEVLVVQKQLVLKEELRITKRVSSETVEAPVDLRKQSATITRS